MKNIALRSIVISMAAVLLALSNSQTALAHHWHHGYHGYYGGYYRPGYWSTYDMPVVINRGCGWHHRWYNRPYCYKPYWGTYYRAY